MLDMEARRVDPARIMVFGLGGGGSNAINRMIAEGLRDVTFWVANTDAQALENSICDNRHQLGMALTGGLGAGGDPEVGRAAAEEDNETLAEILEGYDMVFLTAGMGGGTGTGSVPVVARIARSLGSLTVAIVTRPFSFENRKRITRAEEGIVQLANEVDTMIVIPNDKLLHLVDRDAGLDDGLRVADEILYQSTRGIADIIMGNGLINVDFADVRTVMRNRGAALLGCGVAEGPNRSLEASQAAVSSPLLDDLTIQGAAAILVNVVGGPDMGFHEVTEAAKYIAEQAGKDCDVYWGAVVDPSLGSEMRVTLIATGFDRTPAIRKVERPASAEQPAKPTTEVPEIERAVSPSPPVPSAQPVESAARSISLSKDESPPFAGSFEEWEESIDAKAADSIPDPIATRIEGPRFRKEPAEKWIEEPIETEEPIEAEDRGPALWRRRPSRRLRLSERMEDLELDGRNPLDIPTFLRKQMD